mgnify:CR=1 FL=1
MGCAASSSQTGAGSAVIIKSTSNGHTNNGKLIKECIDPETGEKEVCGSGPTPLIKTNSLTINDKSEQHARTGEEPAYPLPEGDYGDMRLGVTVSQLLRSSNIGILLKAMYTLLSLCEAKNIIGCRDGDNLNSPISD